MIPCSEIAGTVCHVFGRRNAIDFQQFTPEPSRPKPQQVSEIAAASRSRRLLSLALVIYAAH